MKDLYLRPETIKLLGENHEHAHTHTGEMFPNVVLHSDFLDKTPKAQETKTKINS